MAEGSLEGGLDDMVEQLSPEERENLACIIDAPGDSVLQICEHLRWLYHSEVRATVVSGGKGAISFALEKVGVTVAKETEEEQEAYPLPTWEDLVRGLGKKLKVYRDEVELTENELYISHAFIVRALNKMKPDQRKQFFEAHDRQELLGEGDLRDDRLKGPLRTASAIGLANAAGFGLYTAATTALGFATHAVGISLPFAAYVGVTQSIAVAIGPIGWIGAGLYLAWKWTSTDWAKLAPAIQFLIQARAARSVESSVS